MSVDHKEVSEMSRLIAMFNNDGQLTQEATQTVSGKTPVGQSGDPGIAAMRSILEAYNGVTAGFDGVMENLVHESHNDPVLRTAMITENTENGVSIGEWEIRCRQNGKRKLYDVVRVGYGTVIAADLTLYEAAYGIARALSEDSPITCPLIRSLLIFEGEYASALHDAIHHKNSLSKRLVESRRMVLEDRYSEAKRRAVNARHQVETLVGPLDF